MTKNNWQAVTIATQNEAVESVADILRTVGADGVQIVDDQVPVKVIAYFENNEQLSATLNKIQSQLNELQRYDIDQHQALLLLRVLRNLNGKMNGKAITTRHVLHAI